MRNDGNLGFNDKIPVYSFTRTFKNEICWFVLRIRCSIHAPNSQCCFHSNGKKSKTILHFVLFTPLFLVRGPLQPSVSCVETDDPSSLNVINPFWSWLKVKPYRINKIIQASRFTLICATFTLILCNFRHCKVHYLRLVNWLSSDRPIHSINIKRNRHLLSTISANYLSII